MIKIKSITDVITNSSSEVYSYVDEGGKENLKKFINGILKASGSEKTCDELFRVRYKLRYEIDTYWRMYEWDLIDIYCKENRIEHHEFYSLNLTDEEKRACVEKFVETQEEDPCGIPLMLGFIIEPINSDSESIPELDLINLIFDAKEVYL